MTTLTERTDELASLVREHQASIWRYLRFLGSSAHEADDLVQETFLILFRSPSEERGPAQLLGYLRGIARNRLFMLRRKQGRETPRSDLDLAEQVWVEATRGGNEQDYLDALAECIATTVEPRVRQALDLHYATGASRSEIARQLQLTPEGVKTMLRRARKLLRDCVERKVQS
jgi:RNA polymerase sigma-70 factor (ECF subfamily)